MWHISCRYRCSIQALFLCATGISCTQMSNLHVCCNRIVKVISGYLLSLVEYIGLYIEMLYLTQNSIEVLKNSGVIGFEFHFL